MIRGLVSVVICYRNRRRYLAQAVESGLRQDHPSVQLILVDDASTDGSGAVARSFAGPEVSHLRLRRHMGKPAALNRALPHVRGEWWTVLDSDDRMPPGSLRRRVDYLRRHPQALAVMGRIGRLLDSAGRTLRSGHPFRRPFRNSLRVTRRTARVFGGLIPELFAHGTFPVSSMSCTLFRHRVIEELGRLDEDFAPAEDAEYLLRLSLKQPIPFLDESVLWYRVHDRNASFRLTGGQIRCHPRSDLLRKELQERHLRLGRVDHA